MDSRDNKLLVIALVVVAAVSAALSLFYLTVDTDFLATDFGRHIKHAIAFGGLAIVLLVGAVIVRRRSPRGLATEK